MSNTNISTGIGFPGLLAIVFITLKLCNVISWSWWWVLAPLWGPVAILIVCASLFAILAGLFAGLAVWTGKGNPLPRKNKNRSRYIN